MTSAATKINPVALPELEQFFDDATYRVELAESMQRQIDLKLGTRLNIFKVFEPDENKLSDILADLLDPKGSHGQGDLFLKGIFQELNLDQSDYPAEDVVVQREAPTYQILAHRRRIDVLVQADALLAIENKVDSVEQPDQVKDYLEHLSQCTKGGTIRSVLIYLTPNGENPKSISSSDLEGRKKSKELYCWSYQVEIRAWLEACRRACEADKVRHFLSDFIAYIESDLKREPKSNEQPPTNEH